jgi:hypothetical protein
LIIDELGFVPLFKTGAELRFELISQRYERGATIITSNLPFDEWTGTFGEERLTGALLDRLTHHVQILEMNGQSYRLAQSRSIRKRWPQQSPQDMTRALVISSHYWWRFTPTYWTVFKPIFTGYFHPRRGRKFQVPRPSPWHTLPSPLLETPDDS